MIPRRDSKLGRSPARVEVPKRLSTREFLVPSIVTGRLNSMVFHHFPSLWLPDPPRMVRWGDFLAEWVDLAHWALYRWGNDRRPVGYKGDAAVDFVA